MDEEPKLTVEEVLEQATGYWLIATNGQSVLVTVKVDADAESILNCADHLNRCAQEAADKVMK